MVSCVVSRLPLLTNHVPLGKPVSFDTNAGGAHWAGRRLRCLVRWWSSPGGLAAQVPGPLCCGIYVRESYSPSVRWHFPHQLECWGKMQAITMDKSPAVVCRAGEVLENPSC